MKYCFVTILILSIIGISEVSAHKLILELERLDDGRVLAIGYFPDGTPSKNTPVEIYEGDRQVMTGRTDGNGEWRFASPAGVAYIKGVLLGKLGHRTESDILVLAAGATQKNQAVPAADHHHDHREEHAHGGAESHAPPARRIRKEKFPLNNVLAGLGFIFGLTSLVLHFTKKS